MLVYAVYTLLNLGNIFCMSARGSTITGILEEILLLTLYYSLNTTVYSLFSFVVFSSFSSSSFSFSSFPLLLSFSFSFPHVVLVSMYVVTKQLPWSALMPHVINC